MVKTITYNTIPVKQKTTQEYFQHDCCVINGKLTIQPVYPTFSKPHSQLTLKGSRNTLICVCDPTSNTVPRMKTEIFRNNNCCYQQFARSGTTMLSQSYYPTHSQYMKSKCMTYKQNLENLDVSSNGSARANCSSECNGVCANTWYKPNNKTFGVQGAVSSSSRIAQLKYNTLAANGEYLTVNQFRNLHKQFPCKQTHKCS